MDESIRLQRAQRLVGVAIGASLAMWYLPVISGAACDQAQRALIRAVLHEFRRAGSDDEVDAIFDFLRSKLFFLNMVSYAPWLGTSAQVFELYATGQLTIRCARDPRLTDLTDARSFAGRWAEITDDIFSGRSVVASYEQFSGATFPSALRKPFVASVDAIAAAYRGMESIPGVMQAQEIASETARGVKGRVGKALTDSAAALRGVFRR
jgi:hypothetical protein